MRTVSEIVAAIQGGKPVGDQGPWSIDTEGLLVPAPNSGYLIKCHVCGRWQMLRAEESTWGATCTDCQVWLKRELHGPAPDAEPRPSARALPMTRNDFWVELCKAANGERGEGWSWNRAADRAAELCGVTFAPNRDGTQGPPSPGAPAADTGLDRWIQRRVDESLERNRRRLERALGIGEGHG